MASGAPTFKPDEALKPVFAGDLLKQSADITGRLKSVKPVRIMEVADPKHEQALMKEFEYYAAKLKDFTGTVVTVTRG